jgi:TrmH family RNA methyltransferase
MPVPLKPIRWYKKLSDKNGRLEAGAFLVEGDKAIRQIMSIRPDEIIEIISVEEPSTALRRYPSRRFTESQFDSISNVRTPQGIIAVVRIPVGIYSASLPEDTGNKVLLLEDIQDPGNTGTLIRTAAAFGFSGIIMTENCADPLAPKCVQSTAGTVLSVWLRRTPQYLELVRSLRHRGYTMIAAELNGKAEPSVLKREKIVLALGNEAAGLSKAVLDEADFRLSIPMERKKAQSLNVAACGAILMYLSTEK